MKIETIKDRISKLNDKIEKINKTLERHNSQLVKKAKVLTDKGINLDSYDKFDRTIVDHDTYWDICDYEGKLDDIKNNDKKIKEATQKLEALQEQLNNQLAKDIENDNMIPEVLNIFLETWKQKCFKFYIDLSNEYIDLISKQAEEYEITKEELNKVLTKKYIKS